MKMSEMEKRRLGVYKMGPRKLKFYALNKIDRENRRLQNSLLRTSEKLKNTIRNYNGSSIRADSLMSGSPSLNGSFDI
jgi:hypothetical protein